MFYGLRKKILMFFYILSAASLGILFLVILNQVFGITTKVQIVFFMTIVLAGTIGGAFLSVMLDLPKISFYFDEIKNDIANQKIRDPKNFAERIVDLFCDYFNFNFFSVTDAFVKITGADYVYSKGVGAESMDPSVLNDIHAKTKQTEKCFYEGVFNLNEKKVHLYVIPIWFGNIWLGYIGIFTANKLLKIFQSFLSDVENLYIDDQLFHVLNQP